MAVLLNKNDQGVDSMTRNRLAEYRRMGLRVLRCSAEKERNISRVRKLTRLRRCVFVGQSGVGKTSLINLLVPEAGLKTGPLSIKHNRGKHVTRYAVLLNNPTGGWIVDTPGIRALSLAPMVPAELSHHFPDLRAHGHKCRMAACTHIHEPGCAIMTAVEKGRIHEDRYESYLRVFETLEHERG